MSLPGPSRTIVVEPLERPEQVPAGPAPERREAPSPPRETPAREPEREPART